MPGLHLIKAIDDAQPISPNQEQIFLTMLSRMAHFRWYSTDVLHRDSTMILGRSHYNGYPFTIFRGENNTAVIEGAIYNKSHDKIKQELDEISLSGASSDELFDNVERFVINTDGEFFVIKFDEQSGNCLIFNDALGRLPVYYLSLPNSRSSPLVMSREIKFILPFLADPEFDKTALAEYLLFGYCLDDRTPWKCIKRLPPATMVVTGIGNEQWSLREVMSWNLDSKSDGDKDGNDVRREASSLVSLFIDSLRGISQRFSEGYTQVVSLSGGLDSRATLGGLHKIGVDSVACSFPSKEGRIARQTAQVLKANHYMISSSFEISNEDYVELTDGLLDIGLRPRFSYLYGVREKFGDKAILYTGDGGDKTLSSLHFNSRISNLSELLSDLLETDRVFSLDEVSSMLKVPESTLREHLRNHLMSYPEKTLEGKFVHFKLFERGFKWLFVGEDRNRFFLWSATPFYSIRFFAASMKESQRVKDHYRLYKEFLWSLNPALPKIQYYERLVPLSIPNWLLRPYLTAFEWLKRHFYVQGNSNPIGFLFKEPVQEKSDETRKTILRLLKERDTFSFLDSSKIREKVIDERNQTRLNTLATLVLTVNLAAQKDPTESFRRC